MTFPPLRRQEKIVICHLTLMFFHLPSEVFLNLELQQANTN